MPFSTMKVVYCLCVALHLPMFFAVSVYHGVTVSFNCTLSAQENDTLLWEYSRARPYMHRVIGQDTQKKGGFAADPRVSLTAINETTVLTIAGVTLADEGYYQCSPFREESLLIWSLQVYILPADPVIEQNVAADEGEMYIVECLVDGGKPHPQFTWSIIGSDGYYIKLTHATTDSLLSPYNNGSGVSSAKLGVTLTKEMQGASVVCNVYQPGLEQYYNKTVTELIANAMYAPCDPVIRSNGTLTEGQEHWLQCIVDCANPAANITWSIVYSSGQEITLNTSTDTYLFSESSYRTRSEVYLQPTRDMHGADLRCSAVNDVVLRQWLSPPSTSATLDVDYRPVMSIEKELEYSVEGSDLTIRCLVVDAKPSVTDIEWLHNTLAVETAIGSKYRLERSTSAADLIISNVSRSDEGRWQCRGRNAIGSGISNELFVHVLYKPVCLQQKTTMYAAELGDVVQVACRVTAKPAEVLFKWIKSGVELDVPSANRKLGAFTAESVIEIVPSVQSDYGVYECYAENIYGTQESPCLIQLGLPGPAEAPSDCQVSAVTLTSLAVICSQSADAAPIVSYNLKLLQGGEYTVLYNKSLPVYNVTGLEENSTYSFIVCASNYQYWMEEKCTANILGTTAKRYALSKEARALTSPLPSVIRGISSETLYILIASLSAGLVVLSVCIALCCYCRRTKNSADGDMKAKQDTLAMQF